MIEFASPGRSVRVCTWKHLTATVDDPATLADPGLTPYPQTMKRDYVGLDGNVISYLVDAMSGNYDPKFDPDPVIRRERVAALKIFLYASQPNGLYVPPTASAEIARIPDAARRYSHLDARDIHFPELLRLDQRAVSGETKRLLAYHTKEPDCRLAAECIVGGLELVLTFDRRFRRSICGRGIEVNSPSGYLASLSLSAGAQPQVLPHHTNPLHGAKWWRV